MGGGGLTTKLLNRCRCRKVLNDTNKHFQRDEGEITYSDLRTITRERGNIVLPIFGKCMPQAIRMQHVPLLVYRTIYVPITQPQRVKNLRKNRKMGRETLTHLVNLHIELLPLLTEAILLSRTVPRV